MTYNTGRRDEIIAFFRAHPETAFSLDEVCNILLECGSGKSSLYRIVGKLTDEGIIKKLTSSNSRHCKYQYVGDGECHSHLHLKCLCCGRLLHLEHNKSRELANYVLSLGNFTLDEKYFLFGKCDLCTKTRLI